MILHDYLHSGNGYKVRLLLQLQGRNFVLREYDITRGETRTADFLTNISNNGRIPALEFDDGRILTESNAILLYLAEGTAMLPSDVWMRAQVMQWLFFEQYEHEPTIAVLRSWLTVKGIPDYGHALLPIKQQGAMRALQIMEDRLSRHDWLVGDGLSVADISLYAYTHVAEEGQIALAPYPGVRAWIDRIAALPGYVPITWKPAQ